MVQFGEYLKKNSIPGWLAHYLKYERLKELIEKKPQENGHFDEHEFIVLITAEQERIDLFVSGKITEIVNNLDHLETRTDHELANEVSANINALNVYIKHSLEGFRKIMKKFKKKTGLSAVWYESGIGERHLHKSKNVIHELIVQLSEYFKRFLVTEAVAKGKWEPPSAFSRKTVKYWVTPENAVKLKLFVIRHLPILELNDSKRVKHKFYKQALGQTHNFISSVYFDNVNMDCYHRRIAQEEGAQLLRIRWYGGRLATDKSILPVPDGDAVFVERKTHHECWVPEQSTKERFPFSLNMVPQFLSGEISAEKAFDVMGVQGMVKDGDAATHIALAKATQEWVLRDKLHPVLRTVYHRTAFQRSDSNAVRISFDVPCYFVKENNHPDFWNNLDYQGVVDPFEFGVLEIKTASEATPEWIDSLLATGWLTPVQKFSKFQTTVAQNYSERLRVFPHWIDSIEFTTDGEANGAASYLQDAGDKNADAVVVNPLMASVSASSATNAPTGDTKHLSTSSTKRVAAVESTVHNRKADTLGSERRTLTLKKSNLQRTKVEPKTYFANERTFIQWMSAAILIATFSSAIMTINDTARIAGTLFVPVAFFFMFYALGVYQWRLNKINARDGTRFDDPYGPWILATTLSFVMVATLVVAWTRDTSTTTESTRTPSFGEVSVQPPLQFLDARFAKCEPVGLSAAVPPASWEIQEALDVSTFSTYALVYDMLRVFEARLAPYYAISEVTDTWDKTEEFYCIPSLYPDCTKHYLRKRLSSQEVIVKQIGVNASFVPPQTALMHEEKYELDARCDGQSLAYSMKINYTGTVIDDRPPDNTADIDSLLTTPFYDASVPIIADAARPKRYQVLFQYTLSNLGGTDAKVSLELTYLTDERRSRLDSATRVDLELRLAGVGVTLASIRQAEAVMEMLSTPSGTDAALSDGSVIAIALGCFAAVLLGAVGVAYWYSHQPTQPVAAVETPKVVPTETERANSQTAPTATMPDKHNARESPDRPTHDRPTHDAPMHDTSPHDAPVLAEYEQNVGVAGTWLQQDVRDLCLDMQHSTML